jgi:hypothetical protein
MRKFVTSTSQSEVLGQLFLIFFTNLVEAEVKPLLKKHNLEQIDPEKWYPQQVMFDIFREIYDNTSNFTDNLVAVGMKAVEAAAAPPGISSVESALGVLQVIHDLNVRNGVEGEGFPVKMLGKGHAHVTNNTPYPDDAFYGYLWGLVRRFVIPGRSFSVRPLASSNGNNSDESTVFEVRWDT